MGSPLGNQIAPLAKGLLREILSEPGVNGTGSMSRTASLLIVLFTLGWVTYVVATTGKLDMATITAAMTFMGGGGFVFYGTNRVTSRKEGVPREPAPPQG